MKKIFYIPFVAATILLSGCGDDFLERDDLYTISSGNYFSTPEQINSGLTAAYSQLANDEGRYDQLFVANLLSDDCFGGGGPDDVPFYNTDGFFNTISSQYEPIWRTMYAGIFRANLVLENIDNVTYATADAKNQAKGEAYFLRAYYHFSLSQFFGEITLKTSSAPGLDVNTPINDIFGQIAQDLKTAIEIMPSKPYTSVTSGHATKWAAQGLMARAFLYYTGFYGQTEIALPSGGSVTKANVTAWLDDCIANSGHALVDDFRNLWPIASCGDDTGGEFEYPYAIDNGLHWVGDGNIETVFAIKYSIYADFTFEGGADQATNSYANILSYSNQMVLFSALRGQENRDNSYPFGYGWGGGQINPQLYDSYSDEDMRKAGSIINVRDSREGNITDTTFVLDDKTGLMDTIVHYEWGKWDCQQETGLGNKKYTPVTINTDNGPRGMYSVIYGAPNNGQLENMQDEILIRFADILLMAAELKEDVALLNQVRTRAGLSPLGSYSLEALQEERRHELAFEGLRYFDIQRWGIADEVFAKVKDIPVLNSNVPGTYTSTYRSETKGFLPIPESQINISNGGLKQNAGWE